MRHVAAERIAWDVHRPRAVDVACQDGQVGDLLALQEVEHARPRHRVTVPHVHVLRRRTGGRYWGKQDLLPEHAPGGSSLLRTPQGIEEPCFLVRAEQRPARSIGADRIARTRLPIAQPAGVQHQQVHQTAEAEVPVQPDAWSRGLANGHPLEVRLVRGTLADAPVGVAALVCGSAAAPRVVHDLMVVPDGDEGVGRVRGLQVDVGAIGGVARAVIHERRGLAGRQRNPPGIGSVAVHAVGELVDVVAQVQHGVEIGPIRHAAIHVEVTGGVVRTGYRGEPHPVGRVCRQGLRTADRGGITVGIERVVVGPPRRQARDVYLDGVVSQRRGLDGRRRDHVAQLLVGADAPADLRGVCRRGDASPDDDAVSQRIAAGDTVTKEPRRGLGLARAGKPRPRDGSRRALNEPASGNSLEHRINRSLAVWGIQAHGPQETGSRLWALGSGKGSLEDLAVAALRCAGAPW